MRSDRDFGTSVRLAVVLAVLVSVNVYVFFFSPGSLKQVAQAAQQAAAQSGDPLAVVEPPPAPVAPVAAPAAGKRPWKEGAVREHEGLGAALRREGLPPADADHVLRALAPIMGLRRDVHAGQRFRLRTGADGHLEGFELTGKGAVFTVARVDGKWVGKKAPPPSVTR
jgi:hypothetical protein